MHFERRLITAVVRRFELGALRVFGNGGGSERGLQTGAGLGWTRRTRRQAVATRESLLDAASHAPLLEPVVDEDPDHEHATGYEEAQLQRGHAISSETRLMKGFASASETLSTWR